MQLLKVNQESDWKLGRGDVSQESRSRTMTHLYNLWGYSLQSLNSMERYLHLPIYCLFLHNIYEMKSNQMFNNTCMDKETQNIYPIYIVVYHSAIKKSKIIMFVGKCKKLLQLVTESKTIQYLKEKGHTFFLLCVFLLQLFFCFVFNIGKSRGHETRQQTRATCQG